MILICMNFNCGCHYSFSLPNVTKTFLPIPLFFSNCMLKKEANLCIFKNRFVCFVKFNILKLFKVGAVLKYPKYILLLVDYLPRLSGKSYKQFRYKIGLSSADDTISFLRINRYI